MYDYMRQNVSYIYHTKPAVIQTRHEGMRVLEGEQAPPPGRSRTPELPKPSQDQAFWGSNRIVTP